MWREVVNYARAVGTVGQDGQVDISATLRDLIRRGLADDRGQGAGYASGFQEGRSEGFAQAMLRLAGK